MRSSHYLLSFAFASLCSATLCYAQGGANSSTTKPTGSATARSLSPSQPALLRRVGLAEVYFYEADKETDRKAYTLVKAGMPVYTKQAGQVMLEQLVMNVSVRLADKEGAEPVEVFLKFSLYKANSPLPMFAYGDSGSELAIKVDGQLIGGCKLMPGVPTRLGKTGYIQSATINMDYLLFLNIVSGRRVDIQLGSISISLTDEVFNMLRDIRKAVGS